MLDNFIEIDNKLHNLISYHYSPYEFDVPSYNKVIENRPNRGTHSNSYLGLWSCTFPSFFKGDNEFGTYVYKITFKPDIKVGYLRSSDFFRYCNNIEFSEQYIDEHYKYIKLGYDVIVILDHFMGEKLHLGEIITLNFDCIDVFERVECQHISDYTYFI